MPLKSLDAFVQHKKGKEGFKEKRDKRKIFVLLGK